MNYYFYLTYKIHNFCSIHNTSILQIIIIIIVNSNDQFLVPRSSFFFLEHHFKHIFIMFFFFNEFRADLVPVFSFGENELFQQAYNPQGSRLRRFQETVRKWLTFAPVVFYGRGIFQYNFGLLPFRRKITTIGIIIKHSKHFNLTLFPQKL